jgi:wee1-like protein kinase
MFLINLGSYQIRDNLKFLINLGWMIYDKYENLDKVDIFCLGAASYELIRGTPFPDSGPHFANIKEGRITLLPRCPMQFQSLIKV